MGKLRDCVVAVCSGCGLGANLAKFLLSPVFDLVWLSFTFVATSGHSTFTYQRRSYPVTMCMATVTQQSQQLQQQQHWG